MNCTFIRNKKIFRCTKCCIIPNMGPKLQVSGYSKSHPVAICPVCYEMYWEHKDGTIKNYPPFKWGQKEKKQYETDNSYYWKKK